MDHLPCVAIAANGAVGVTAIVSAGAPEPSHCAAELKPPLRERSRRSADVDKVVCSSCLRTHVINLHG